MMSVRERSEMQQLLRQRERVLRSAAKQRSAELLADFENQLGQQFSFDQDEVWAAAVTACEVEIRKATKLISDRCVKLGIPAQFAPSVNVSWYSRGANSTKERRAELRRMAETRIAAIEQAAVVEIGKATVSGQLAIASSGIVSDAAKAFVDSLPPIEALMPILSFSEIAGEAEPTIVEQLLSSNALRQKRWRDRNKDASLVALRNAESNAAIAVIASDEAKSE